MAFDNNMRGVMFLQDKQGNEKRPDWRGSIEIDSVPYWISGWEQKTPKGDLVISLKIEPKADAPRVPLAQQMDDQARDAQQHRR